MKQTLRVLWILIVTLGLRTLPTQAQDLSQVGSFTLEKDFSSSVLIAQGNQPDKVLDAQVGALVEALRLAAPKTGIQNDGLYSEWQVLPTNIPRWSKQCRGQELTPTQFEASPVTARWILVCVMRDVLQDQYKASNSNESVAVQRAAAWWMTGDATRYNNEPTASYTQKVLRFYQQLRSNRSAKPRLLPHR